MLYANIDKLIRHKLSGIYPDRESRSISRLVLEHLTGLSWVQIQLNQDKELTPDQEYQISEIIARLEKHEPVQYVLGETEFYGIKLKVGPGVLIPRGETEELVDWVIECCGAARGPRFREDDRGGGGGLGRGPRFREDDKGHRSREGERKLKILDIGCGSGAIAIALAKHLPDAEIIAADISENALHLTCENAASNNLNITVAQIDILEPQPLVILAEAGTSSRCTALTAGTSSRCTALTAGTSSRCTALTAGTSSRCTALTKGTSSRCTALTAGTSSRCTALTAGTSSRCTALTAGTSSRCTSLPTAADYCSGPFDIIVSNPPYVPMGERVSMDLQVVEYEPKEALFVPDDDPLVFYKAIAEFAASNLKPGGQVYVEVHARLGEETADVFRKLFSSVELRKDIHGKNRMILAYHG